MTTSLLRSHHPVRIVARTTSPGLLADELTRAALGSTPANITIATAPRRVRDVAFLFAGQGGHWPGMGRDLARVNSGAAEVLERCDHYIRSNYGWSLRDAIESETPLDSIDRVQPATFAMQVALARALETFGVTPRFVLGQSMGEVAAAVISGGLTLQHGLDVITRRSVAMREVAGGAMAAIELPGEELAPLLAGTNGAVELAVRISPTASVVSGDRDAVLELVARLAARDVFARVIRVDVASHSRQMDPIESTLLAKLAHVRSANATIAFASTVEVGDGPTPMLDARYWWRNLREPVLLWDAVAKLYRRGVRTFIEVSPHPVLHTTVLEGLETLGTDASVVPTMRRDTSPIDAVLDAVAATFARGHAVDWKTLAPKDGRRIDLPAYPWQRGYYWSVGETALDGGTRASLMPQRPTSHPARQSQRAPLRTLAPETTRRGELLSIVSRVLRVAKSDIDPSSTLVDLGIDSMRALELARRIKQKFQANVSSVQLLRGMTIAELENRVFARLERREASDAPAASISDQFALTPNQEAIWFDHMRLEESAAYNVPLLLRIRGPIVETILEDAIRGVIRGHPMLRSVVIAREDGKPVQSVRPPADVPVSRLERDGAEEATVLREALDESRRPFDVAAGPLVRVSLYRRSETERILLINFHHLVVDLWSLDIFVREVRAAYRNAREGPQTSEISIQQRRTYAQYAAWLDQYMASDEGTRALAEWISSVPSNTDPILLPTNLPTPRGRTGEGDSLRFPLGALRSTQIKEVAREQGVTPFAVLLTLFGIAINRHTEREDVVLGVPFAGRSHVEDESTIGYFVNPLPIGVRVGAGSTFADVLRSVHNRALFALEREDVPSAVIARELSRMRDSSERRLFNMMFVFQSTMSDSVFGDGGGGTQSVSVEHVELPFTTAKFDLTLFVQERGGEFVLTYSFASDVYDTDSIGRFASHLQTLLESALRDPTRRTCDLEMLSLEELSQLRRWSSHQPLESRDTFVDRFEHQARLTSSATALVASDRSMTYGELELESRVLAQTIAAAGAEPGGCVLVSAERLSQTVVGMLGVMRMGAAYVPVEPDLPAERVGKIAERVRAAVAIVGPRGLQGLPSSCRVVRPGRDRGMRPATAAAGRRPNPDDLAYVIFTSGSTGEPKGVAIEHAQLNGYVDAVVSRIELSPGFAYAHVSTFAADLGHTSLFPSLVTGGALHVVPADTSTSPDGLGEYMHEHGIDCLKIVPSHFRTLFLAASDPGKLLPKRRLIFGGDRFGWDLYAMLARRDHRLRVYNHYGPTETTIGIISSEVRTVDSRSTTVPLGVPLAHAAVQILDAQQRPVPIGVVGEIYAGGACVARGYLGDPVRTAERFVDDPSAAAQPQRMYRTGDRARWLPNGAIEFLGRGDSQVKIAGYRVELGEVEAAIRKSTTLVDVCLIVDSGGPSEEAKLEAYVVTNDGSTNEVRATLERLLPKQMIPSRIVAVASIPLTPNGKPDHRALRAAGGERTRRHTTSTTAMWTIEEATVAEVFARVLGFAPERGNADFFKLGGTSLQAIRVCAELGRIRGERIPLSLFLSAPTVQSLATALRASAPREAPVVEVLRQGAGLPIVLLHSLSGDLAPFRALVSVLGNEVPIFGIQVPSAEVRFGSFGGRATHYTDALPEAVVKEALFVGWSAGGVMAHELARRSLARGGSPRLLMIDSSDPTQTDWRTWSERDFLRWWLTDVGLDARLAGTGPDVSPEAFAQAARVFEPNDRTRALAIEAELRSSFARATAFASELREHHPNRFDGEATYIAATGSDGRNSGTAWEAYVSRLDIIPVATTHRGVLTDPHVNIIAANIGELRMRPFRR